MNSTNRPEHNHAILTTEQRQHVQISNVPSRSSACARVFHTPELAELIFLHLPLSTLLCTVPRTCRWWHEILTTSGPLQERLFLRSPAPGDLLVYHADPHPAGSCAHDPRIPRQAPSARDAATAPPARGSGYWSPARDPDRPRRVCENPHLWILFGGLASTHAPYGRPEASWRRQLLTQPAVRGVDVFVLGGGSDGGHEETSDAREDAGRPAQRVVAVRHEGDGDDAGGGVTLGDLAGLGGKVLGIRGHRVWERAEDSAVLRRVKEGL